MDAPLCPELYERLVQVFGRVQIRNQGEALVQSGHNSLLGKDYGLGSEGMDALQQRTEFLQFGEYYACSCPFCNDTRRRLWINHRWGEFPYLAVCYNENCLKGAGRVKALQHRIFSYGMPIRYAVREGTRESGVLVGIQPPGDIQPLHTLPETHIAVRYLQSRSYDSSTLSAHYGAGFCHSVHDGRHAAMVGRIYIPVYMRGELVGWQGRLPYDPPKGGPVKYYNLPGMAKRLMLYNYDNAYQYNQTWVLEGAVKVWRHGPWCVGTLGMFPSPYQRKLLTARYGGGRGEVVLCPDGNARIRDEYDEPWFQELWRGLDGRLRVVCLPEDVDAGDLATDVLAQLIAAAPPVCL